MEEPIGSEREEGVSLGLTAAQSEFWLAHELSPGGSSNRIAQFVDLDGALDVSLMKRSVRQALDECEPMRCRFVASGAELRVRLWKQLMIGNCQ